MKMHYAHGMSSGRIAEIVGAFVVIPLLGLIGVGIFMAKAEHLFEEKYVVMTSLTKSYGLQPGMPVLMAGIPIGRVQAVELDQQGAIAVALELRLRYQDRVRTDSVATVSKSGLIGQTQVQVSIGSPNQPILRDGASIKSSEPREMAEMVDEIMPILASVQGTLQRVEQIAQDVHAAVQTGGQVLINVEQASRELPTVVASVQRTAASVERTTSSLPDLTNSVKKTMASVDRIVGDVQQATGKLPAVTEATQEAADNIRVMTESLKSLSRELRPLLGTAHGTLEEVSTIVRGAKKTFPVNVMIKNAEQEEKDRPRTGLQSLRGDQLSR